MDILRISTCSVTHGTGGGINANDINLVLLSLLAARWLT